MTMPTELQAARLRLVKDRPYLAAAAWALQPVEKPGLGTLAVDMWWRLYFDPAVTARWTVEELAGVLYHEICHLIRDHAARMREFDRVAANIAADAEINDDLLGEGVHLPGEPITPAAIGQLENLLAEEYYAALQAQQSAPSQGASAQPGNSEPRKSTGAGKPEAGDTQQGGENEAGDGSADPDASDSAQDTASAPDPGNGAENGSDSSPTAAGGSQAGDAQPNDRGDTSGSKAGDSDGSKPGDGGDSMSSPASGQPSDSSAQPGASSQPSAGPVSDGRAGGQDGRESGAGAQTPAPGAGRCGSCATGQPEPWEDGPPAEGSPGISRAEAELIRRDVARQIAEASRSRGTIPGHWARWAEEKLRPKVDWRRELATAVRHAMADVAGASDYSYRRPSRRQGQVGNGKVVLPSLRRPVPAVAVVVDTSGSVDDAMLAQALAEVSGILKALGQREGVHVLAVDAAVHTCRRVFRPDQVHLGGGGGTDMGAGLAAVARLQPRPQVAIVITDGNTPWPDAAPRGLRVIVALTEDKIAPSWAKKVIVSGE